MRIRQPLECQLTHANSQTVGASVGDIQLQGVSVVWDESVVESVHRMSKIVARVRGFESSHSSLSHSRWLM